MLGKYREMLIYRDFRSNAPQDVTRCVYILQSALDIYNCIVYSVCVCIALAGISIELGNPFDRSGGSCLGAPCVAPVVSARHTFEVVHVIHRLTLSDRVPLYPSPRAPAQRCRTSFLSRATSVWDMSEKEKVRMDGLFCGCLTKRDDLLRQPNLITFY